MVSLPLFWFAPFLIYFFYKKPFKSVLLWALSAGVVLDLVTPSLHFGIIPLIMIANTWFWYGHKKHFFIDSLSTFPLLTALFSFTYTLMLAVASGIPVTFSWFMTDLVLMPLADGLLAFLTLTVPLILWGPKRRRGEEYFL
jgi:hypothetical protein